MPLLDSEPLLSRPAALAMRLATDVVAVLPVVALRARLAGLGLRVVEAVVEAAAFLTVLVRLLTALV